MKKVGIICGGFSSEFNISVQSARTIQSNFPQNYDPFLVFLNKEGWFIELKNGDKAQLDANDFTYLNNDSREKIDLAIVYIHGDPGENGKVQAYLEMIGIPYVNSGPLASELSFDKWFCNQFLKGFGIQVAESIYLTNPKFKLTPNDIISRLKLPVFVKPCDSGSSYGIARVDSEGELLPAIKAAFQEGKTVLIESFLDGTEVTCGVYRSVNGIEALPLTEIVPKTKFFDFQAKYEGLSDEITPARISEEATLKIQNLSKKIYDLLQLRSIARIDFMLVGNEPYVIEVNTTPGFSPASLVPQMINAAGKTIKEFWQEILDAELLM